MGNFEEQKMKVELIDYSQNALGNIVTAARGCFGNKKKNPTYEDNLNLVRALIKQDHSPVEFAWAMFKISGISRICANQLNRYRLSSQCQTSMRYVESAGEFVHPFTCLEISDACQDLVDTCFKFYKKLINNGVPREDARFYLPLGTMTELTIAFNFREMRHILKQRLDSHAQWEVRQVAHEILLVAKERWPWLVEDIDG
jgi:thymidylate synthase (FAD)